MLSAEYHEKSRPSNHAAVAQFDLSSRASVLCAARDLGEPREASRSLRRNNRASGSLPYRTNPHYSVRFVIPSKRSLRSEGSGRAARSVAFFATQQSRVWLASLSI